MQVKECSKYLNVDVKGRHPVWILRSGGELRINSIDLFGYVKISGSTIVKILVEIKKDREWSKVGGALLTENKNDFSKQYNFDNLATDKGDGVSPVVQLKVEVIGNNSINKDDLDINLIVLGFEYN